MKLSDYRNFLDQIPHGKRLPGALYVYRDDAGDFGVELNQLLAQVAAVYQIGQEFNLVKFRTDELRFRLSLIRTS